MPVSELFGDGPLALAVNQVNGGLAIGYHDRNTGELWLGGCPSVGCPDLSLKPAGRWQTADDGAPSVGRLTLAAARTGPVAVPPEGRAGTATVVVCEDATCDSHHELTVDTPPGGASLVTDQDGTAYVVSAAVAGSAVGSAVGSRPALTLIAVADQGREGSTPLLIPSQDAQRVVAVIFDSDDRPRVLLSTLAGLVVITCSS